MKYKGQNLKIKKIKKMIKKNNNQNNKDQIRYSN